MSDEVTLYNGTVKLAFDSKKHVYTVATTDGYVGAVPSITTILRVIGKGDALTQWAANCAADYIREALTPGQSLDEIQIGSLADSARFAFRRKSKEACDIGTLVHKWVEDLLTNMRGEYVDRPCFPVNPQAALACQAAARWLGEHLYRPQATETRLYSLKHNYAGTADAQGVAASVNGKLAIVDWKTSRSVYDEYILQVAAYSAAFEEMTGQRVHEGWVVRIGKKGELEDYRISKQELRQAFQVFLAAKKLYEWKAIREASRRDAAQRTA